MKPLAASEAMTLSELYRIRATALAEQAKYASEPIPKKRFARMALAYGRLAEKYAKHPPLYKKKTRKGGTTMSPQPPG